MESEFNKVVAEYLSEGDTIVVGVSGGPDSTVLLDLLLRFSKKVPLKIIVAHVNHGIRGKDAGGDEKFVRKMAENAGLVFECKRVKLTGSSIEEQGRNTRRVFFEKSAKKHKARYILTAHTQDDQVETVVFNFFRGSGVAGLAGMRVCNGLYLKPLLDVGKRGILGWARAHKLKFRVDKTNNQLNYTRNFVRKKLLPMAEKINASFRKTLVQNSSIFREVDNLVESHALQFIKEQGSSSETKSKLIIPLKKFADLHNAIKPVVIQQMYKTISHSKYCLANRRIQEILRLASREIGNKKIICDSIIFAVKSGCLECALGL